MSVSAVDTIPRSTSSGFGIFSPEKRENLHIKEKRWVILLSVRCFTALLSIAGVILFVVVYNWSLRFLLYSDDNILAIAGMSPLALSALVCLINIAFFIFGAYPLHPGINVALDLIAWMALVIVGVLDTLMIAWDLTNSLCIPYSYYNNSPNVSSGYTMYGFPTQASCQTFETRTQRFEIAGIAFIFLCAILHFALWVQACRRTHTRRMEVQMTLTQARAIIERNNSMMAQMEKRMEGAAGYETAPLMYQRPTETAPLMYQLPTEQSRVTQVGNGLEEPEEIAIVPRIHYAEAV